MTICRLVWLDTNRYTVTILAPTGGNINHFSVLCLGGALMKEEIKLNKKELEYQRKIADKYPELIGKKAAYRQDAEIDSRQTEL